MKKLISALTFADLALSVTAQTATVDSKLEWFSKAAAADKSMAVSQK